MRDRDLIDVGPGGLPRPSPFRPDQSRRVRYERALYHEVWEPIMQVWRPLAGGAVRFWRGLSPSERWGVGVTVAMVVLLAVMLVVDFRMMPTVR
ncbi:MAG: hypothetical protein JWN27_2940 [Candidatus Eremiobacteraeota bacterium]|nr:hypothetical protein [Candidatus Eremiobacteraeota bacterium]